MRRRRGGSDTARAGPCKRKEKSFSDLRDDQRRGMKRSPFQEGSNRPECWRKDRSHENPKRGASEGVA